MNSTLGMRIAELRHQKGLRQDDVAEVMGVSPQAVSKWENDLAYPDVLALPKLAKLFDVSVDTLLNGESEPETKFVPVESRKNIDEMILKVKVDEFGGENTKVRVNLPVPLIKILLESGASIEGISNNAAMRDIDFAKILGLVEKGVIGKIVEIDSGECHVEVEVVVE